MAKELLLPELAESVVEGEILKWLVAEGDEIKQDQPVVEVMTDKVTVELPSPFAGRLEKQLVKEGDVVPVHAPIALIAEAGEAAKPTTEAHSGPSNMPSVPSITAAEERSIIEAATIATEDTGDAQSLFRAFGEAEAVRMPTLRGREGGASQAAVARAGTNAFGRPLAVPAARKLARENGLEIADVPGSGPNGRVRVGDVMAVLETDRRAQPESHPRAGATESRATTAAPTASNLPGPVLYKTPKGYEHLETRTPLRGLRRAISNQMLASHIHTVRTLTVDEIDLSSLVELRKSLKPHAEEQGVKLTFLPFFIKASASALRTHPILNSSIDDATGEIVSKSYYNIGVAVDSPNGLIVPVIKDVDKKSIMQIARELQDLADKTRDGKLAPEDTQGSTFSITNIGSIGALFSFPIINVPDAAILGIHSIQERPVVRNAEIVIRSMMYFSVSFDHRIVDGAEAARFSKTLIELMQDPNMLLVYGV